MVKQITGRFRALRVVGLALLAVLMYGVFSVSEPAASSNLKITSVDLAGVNGATNTVSFAFDRYALVASYAPSKEVVENGDVSQLDNHYINLIDLKKPSGGTVKDLTNARGDSLYYPTKVVFDEPTGNVYVLGITFHTVDGELESSNAIAYFHLNFVDGKPAFDDSVVIIDIEAVKGSDIDGVADFGLGKRGDLLVFKNGASLFTYSLEQGYVYRVDIVPPREFSADSNISLLQVDDESGILAVSWNRRVSDDKGNSREVSELSFYNLKDDGTLDLVKRSYSSDFPDQSFLTRGSNVVVISDEDGPKQSMFVSSDGSLCQVSLKGGDLTGEVKRLAVFEELAQSGASEPSARILKYDAARRSVGIVKQGFTTQIARPTNGRRGRIARPTNALLQVENPAITVAKFGKKDRISQVVFSEEFASETGLSNLTSRTDSEWLVASYSGKLYSLTLQDDITASTLVKQGEVGSRVERIDYQASRESVVAINSFATDETGASITEPGAVVVGRFIDSQAMRASFVQMLLPAGSLTRAAAPSIRRPCNSKR